MKLKEICQQLRELSIEFNATNIDELEMDKRLNGIANAIEFDGFTDEQE